MTFVFVFVFVGDGVEQLFARTRRGAEFADDDTRGRVGEAGPLPQTSRLPRGQESQR